jgi:hypothetical protein
MAWFSASDTAGFLSVLNSFVDEVAGLGPLTLSAPPAPPVDPPPIRWNVGV